MSINTTPYPSFGTTITLVIGLLVAVVCSLAFLLSVNDPVYLKALIEDDGPVQLVGQIAITAAFVLCLLYTVVDKKRYSNYLSLSYLLLFYTLREADYHYELSDHAKASQFKRFFSHELIPLSSKLFLLAIVIVFFIAVYRLVKSGRAPFFVALRKRLPWAIFVVLWGGDGFFVSSHRSNSVFSHYRWAGF